MAAKGLPYALPSSYESLISKVDEVVTKANSGTVKMPETALRDCFKRDNLTDPLTFVYEFQLRNWHARKERVHIVIQVQETITGVAPYFVLAKSTVRVSYFSVDGKKAFPLHTIHFDYGPAQKCHPIFHAQLTADHLSLSAEDLIELGHELVVHNPIKIFKNARIPTADMSLPSVLICLVADHIDNKFFPGFLDEVRDLQDKLPRPLFDHTKFSLQRQPHHLGSSHWYAHPH